MKVGIEAIHFDIPKIYVPIQSLAKARGIEVEKLQLGLGLERMSVPDYHQDAVVFGANAVKKLIENEALKAHDFDRIYVGTESGVDGSKPIASYLVSLIEKQCYHPGYLSHVDVVDLTFACIGAVDALQNSIDFIKAHPHKKAIVVATDVAKYDLNSSGEYTQGAGAVALLISASPTLMEIDDFWAVSTEGVFDFFKPRRRVLAEEITVNNENEIGEEAVVEIFKEQPVFDGQYSNACYLQRTQQAYFRLKEMLSLEKSLFKNWDTICMHLPYCYQARRIFTHIYIEDQEKLRLEKEQCQDTTTYLKSVSKSQAYQRLIQEKIYPTEIASAQIGNMYTASLLMGMLSALAYHFKQNSELTNRTFGFIAYGSGSKSKAFQAKIGSNWKDKIRTIPLFQTLENAQPIDMETYTALHQLRAKESIVAPSSEFYLAKIESEKGVLEGARYYQFAP